jgi:hypothetical protein
MGSSWNKRDFDTVQLSLSSLAFSQVFLIQTCWWSTSTEVKIQQMK